MTVLDFLHHPALFGGSFANGDEWVRWEAFLAATFGLPMTDEQVAVYRRFTGRITPPQQRAREIYAIVGRRGGKSRIAAAIAAYMASQDYSDKLAPGEWATVAVIAADRQQAGIVSSYARALLKESPLLAPHIGKENAETIELKNQTRIEVTTASHRTTRGYTFAAVIADELAFWRSDESVAPDTEVMAAVRPGLATLRGLVVGISSPYARRGVLWQAFKQHYGKDGDPVLVWRAASRDMNPTLPEDIVQAALGEDESAARAEYLAEFRRDLEAFVAREVLEACTVRGRAVLPPIERVNYVGFVDPSGGSQDSMTLGIAHAERRESGESMVVLDHLSEVKPPFNPDAVVAEFAEVLKSYRLSHARGDRYGGEWVASSFAKYGIVYEAEERTKSELYGSLLALLNSGRCELLERKVLEAQLLGLERRSSRQGKDSIDHQPGGHDDVANAAAGALVNGMALVALEQKPVIRARQPSVASGARTRIDWTSADVP